MIGVVVPAHNEDALLGSCLSALCVCTRDPELKGERVDIVVVLDDCSDASARVAKEHGVDLIRTDARNVGMARALGCERLLARGARWLALTDADTMVSASWLSSQLALKADAVCGSIGVHWTAGMDAIRREYELNYEDADGHRHIHGANMGVSAGAYRRAGGFRALTASEDVAFVRALESSGAQVAWSAAPRVLTSARLKPRASGGFGDDLLRAAQRLCPSLVSVA